MAERKKYFINHVYFWLTNPESKEDFNRLVEGLRKLSRVKTIREFHIGRPADTYRDVIERSYSISWFVAFDNPEDQEIYQKDPIHLQFIKECGDLWNRVRVHDSVDVE